MSAVTIVTPAAAALSAEVGPSEYARLLGMPRNKPLEGDIAERAQGARDWYAAHGAPWFAAREGRIASLQTSKVTLDTGEQFESLALASRLKDGAAHALLAVAVTAGPEADAEAQRLWQEEKPDESFFLSRFAAAIVERLVFHAMMWFCRSVEPRGETVLPHLSPGCGGWRFDDQQTLMQLLADGSMTIGPLMMMESGMISPQSSLLAAFGVTRQIVAPTPADACRACDLSPCGFRRAPFSAGRSLA